MEYVTESEALQELDGEAMAHDDYVRSCEERYADNAMSTVGATIRCACCGARIVKGNYQTQFCSNKGQGNCKDGYWNNVKDERRLRAQFFAT